MKSNKKDNLDYSQLTKEALIFFQLVKLSKLSLRQTSLSLTESGAPSTVPVNGGLIVLNPYIFFNLATHSKCQQP